MDIETVTQLLEGYLLSLRRLSGSRCDFWSLAIPLEGDIEGSLTAHLSTTEAEYTVFGKATIGYAELAALLDQHLFSRLEAGDKSHFDLFAWDIVEYIQMSYRDLVPEFDPLHTREAMSFDVRFELYGEHVYLLVPVRGKALVIGLGLRV